MAQNNSKKPTTKPRTKVSKNKQSTDTEVPVGAYGHSTVEQKMFMLTFLEDKPKYRDAILGKSTNNMSMGHGSAISKISAFQEMANSMYEQGLEYLCMSRGWSISRLQEYATCFGMQ